MEGVAPVNPPLYHAVALGMWAYSRVAFAVEQLGVEAFQIERGMLLVSTHRADTDVPLLIPSIYRHGGVWRDRRRFVHFAARDDMFERGFFAGFPPRLPLWLRRLLFPLAIGRALPRVLVHPLRSAHAAKLARVFGAVPPATRLDAIVGETLLEGFRERARQAGLPSPQRVADALRGDYADLLWQTVGPEDVRAEAVWARHGAEAAEDVRRLIGLLRAEEPLVLFPEGRPSPDGAVGPVQRGLRLLIRRGRPRTILPAAVTYDPLARGRTRAFVAFGPAFEPALGDVEVQVLGALRRVMPLTCGSLVAHALGEGARPGEIPARLERAVAEARAEGRPVERALLDPVLRRARLEESLAVASRRPELLRRLAVEYESARA